MRLIKTIRNRLITKWIDLRSMIQPDFKYRNISYSQEGEDILLEQCFNNRTEGFYIDIGCFHPWRFSNTAKLYLNNWKGIVIDPNPETILLMRKYRYRDIAINVGISTKKTKMPFYVFDEPALNTFNQALAFERQNKFKLNEVIYVHTVTLEETLNSYLPKGQTIDFMNIDVEGFELEVLESNNWEKYRPKYVLIEELTECILHKLSNSKIYNFLKSKDFILLDKIGRNMLFKDLLNE